MDSYLTDLAKRHRSGDIPILVVCGILLLCTFSVLDETFDVNELMVSIIATGIMLAIFIVPIVRIVLRRLQQRDARTLARCFAGHRQPLFPIAEIDRQVKVIGGSGRRVEKLLDRGMLKGVELEPGGKAVRLLTVIQPKSAVRYIDIVCPHCGGTNRVPYDNRGCCAYCESLLPLEGGK